MLDIIITSYHNNPLQCMVFLGIIYSIITLTTRNWETIPDKIINIILGMILFVIFYTHITLMMEDINSKIRIIKQDLSNKSLEEERGYHGDNPTF